MRALFSQNLSAVIDRLVRVHGFNLSSDDLASIEYVYRAFYSDGPELRYSFPRQGFGGRWFPSYAELMTATDTDGVEHSYLADERNFQALRSYEVNNLIVPLVGDFGGDKALKSVGRYLAAHRATVTLFYTSNVEQYLFQSGDQWRRFFDNVASLPVNDSSTLLRSYFNMGGMRLPAPAAVRLPLGVHPIGDAARFDSRAARCGAARLRPLVLRRHRTLQQSSARVLDAASVRAAKPALPGERGYSRCCKLWIFCSRVEYRTDMGSKMPSGSRP